MVPRATSAEKAPILAMSSVGLVRKGLPTWTRGLIISGELGVELSLSQLALFFMRFPHFANSGKLVQESGFVSSLRRNYPDQVQRVDGKRSHPLSRVYPSSPLTERTKIRVYKRWLLGFFEEIARPVGPAGLLRLRTEINLQLHSNLQGFQSRCSDNARQLDPFFHFHNSHRIGSHMFELRRRNMDNCVGDELALSTELNPLNPRRPTLWTDCSRRDHNVFAAHAPYGHQLAICALPIELLDCGRW